MTCHVEPAATNFHSPTSKAQPHGKVLPSIELAHPLGVNISSSFGQATVKPSTIPSTNASFVWPGASATSYRRRILLVTLRISIKASCLPTQLYGPVKRHVSYLQAQKKTVLHSV